jgi:ribosomal protein S18 acetylase RimI-like enzyme
LIIKPASASDLSEIQALLVRTWHSTYDSIYGVEKVSDITSKWHSVASLKQHIEKPMSFFLVAQLDGKVVGTSLATGSPDGTVKLNRLYVDPDAQRTGVGSELLASTLMAFPNMQSIDLEVEPQNTKAIAFYRNNGFEVTGTTPNCGGNSGIAAIAMHSLFNYSEQRQAVMFRPVRDSDAQGLLGLIALCFADYPGCFVDPHDDLPDLVRPTQSKLAREGAFHVVEDARGHVAACVGVDFASDGVAELHRLYVRPDMRGQGLGKLLTARMEAFAIARGASRMILWSDTRFVTAHRLYAKLGYAQGITRSLGDISMSREFFFEKALSAP